MKNKTMINTEPQAEINTVLAAGAPETQTKHGHKGFGSVSDSRGLCVGATLKPIIFSGPMVKAILYGRKTQTRRKVKDTALEWLAPDMFTPDFVASPENNLCPYGKVGDTLWVRETWWKKPFLTRKDLKDGADTWPDFEYNVEPIMAWDEIELKHYGWKRMPSIFMPRNACRIELKITGIRIERLQDISNQDAIAEGIEELDIYDFTIYKDYFGVLNSAGKRIPIDGYQAPINSYSSLWKKIYGESSWDSNPFVWVIEFNK